MKFLITGARGTVGSVLVETLRAAGHETETWDRARTAPEDDPACRRWLEEVRPDWVCHLALGAESWARTLAGWCGENGARMLQVSTAMVFDASAPGPYRPDSPPGPRDDYGRYKLRCEEQVREANPRALIARIGWQIGRARGGNQMLEALHGMVEEKGHIAASSEWIPATSFLEDSCAAFLDLMEREAEGVHHVDSNAGCAWTFDRIVHALRDLHGDPDWEVRVDREYVHDQRLLDERVRITSLEERLG